MYNYKTITPFGTFERKSKRVFSHLVVFHGKITEVQVEPNIFKPYHSPEKIHTMLEYCGRYDLAVKASNNYRNKRGLIGEVEIFETQID